MYCYFSSKQEALVALFAKTVEALREKSRAAADDPAAPRDAIATAVRRTRDRWREHGLIMRVAIDQASAIRSGRSAATVARRSSSCRRMRAASGAVTAASA